MKTYVQNSFYGEFLGTLIFAAWESTINITQKSIHDYVSRYSLLDAIGAGICYCLACLLCRKSKGGHFNPGITLTFFAFGNLKWKETLLFWFAQFSGALFGACVSFGIHYVSKVMHLNSPSDEKYDLNDKEEGVTHKYDHNFDAMVFHSYEMYNDNFLNLFKEFAGSFILCICLAAIYENIESKNLISSVYKGMAVTGIKLCFGNYQWPGFNPAVYISRLILLAAMNYELFRMLQREMETFIWILPVLMTYWGGIIGILVYKLSVTDHRESGSEYVLVKAKES